MNKIAAITGLAVAAAAANAGVTSQTQTFAGIPNLSSTLTFNQFGGALADLVSVEVILELEIDGGQIFMDNDGVDAGSANGLLGAEGAISSTDVALISGGFPLDLAISLININEAGVALAGDNGDGPGLIDGSGPDGATFDGTFESGMASGFIDAPFFAGYVGGGTFDIEAAVDTIFDVFGVGGIEGGFSPVSASGSVTIIYNFVPAPGAAAVLGLGGLVATRRRR